MAIMIRESSRNFVCELSQFTEKNTKIFTDFFKYVATNGNFEIVHNTIEQMYRVTTDSNYNMDKERKRKIELISYTIRR